MALAVLAMGAVPAAGAPVLPNLAMAPLTDLTPALTPAGREQLRFSATIVNLGPGRFEVRSTRPRPRGPFVVEQRIFQTGGPPALRPTPAAQVFGGDGHDHWHVRDLQLYELRSPDGAVVRRRRKRGFCFFDTSRVTGRTRPGATRARYPEAGCGGPRATGLTTGISVGWGDLYPWSLPDQFIDITGLAPGPYRLYAEADHLDLFAETDEADNATYVDLRLTRRLGSPFVTVTGRGRP